MSMMSDDGWGPAYVPSHPVIIEKSTEDGFERAAGDIQYQEIAAPANIVEEKLDEPSTDIVNNNMTQSQQFDEQEPIKAEKPTPVPEVRAASGDQQISDTNNIPKAEDHTILSEEPVGESVFSKQNQNAPRMPGNRDTSMIYLAKLSKIYADFGQNLANLHKEFAEKSDSIELTEVESEDKMQNQLIFVFFGGIAIFINSCIVVLHFRPKKTSRSHDRLILIFAILDIVFAVLHSTLLPVFLHQNNTAAFLTVGLFCCFSFSQVLLNVLYIIYLSFIVLVTHSFLYRFAYLCRSTILPVLQRFEYEIFVCICPFIIAAPFMIVGNLKFGPRESLSHAIETSHYEYNVDVYTAAYFAKILGKNEDVSIYGILIFVELVLVALVVVVTCAWCTVLITGRLNKQILSLRARRMHRRMLKLLVCQSLLPLVTLYAPVIFFIISLIVDYPVSPNTSFVLALLFSLFPSLDALLVAFFVRDYRPFAKKEQFRRNSRFAAVATVAMAVRSISMTGPAAISTPS